MPNLSCSELPPESSFLQLNEFDFERLAIHIYEREGNRQLKPARPRASRVDVEYAIALGLPRLMGMPADDDVEAGGSRIQVQSLDIVKNIEEDRARFCYGGIRQIASPVSLIDVSTYRDDGRKFSQSCKNLRLANISCVDDQVGAAKCIQRLRTQ